MSIDSRLKSVGMNTILIHCKDDKNSNSNELILLRSVVLTKNINDFGEICYLPITYAFIWKWFQTKKIFIIKSIMKYLN
jgi:hypothetical protein